MSDVVGIEKITDRAGTGGPNFTNGFNINGSDSGISAFVHTSGTTEPSNPSNGDTWWKTDDESYHVYMNNAWQNWLGDSLVGFYGGDRVLFGGGKKDGTHVEPIVLTIQYWTMTTSGNASTFGNLQSRKFSTRSASSSTRGLWAGGSHTSATDEIDYVTISTLGNAQDFGNLLSAQSYGACHSDGAKFFVAGGHPATNVIQYVTIATTGNAADWGDITSNRNYIMASGDATRGLATGSPLGGGANVIDYWSTQTAGNAADFGDLTQNRRQGAGTSDTTRAVFGGGYQDGGLEHTNIMDYVTVQTLGNATDFGDLINDIATNIGATCNGTIGHWAGGYYHPNASNIIQKVTIQTTGNATDHGDLAVPLYGGDCCSGAPS